jgi:hypothetical protein
LVNNAGKASVILKVTDIEKAKISLAKKVGPYLDKKELEQFLGNDWEVFRSFVKSNRLDLEKREDFIRAFEHLQKVVKARS